MANSNLTDQQAKCLAKALDLYMEVEQHTPVQMIEEFQNLAVQCLEERFDVIIANLQASTAETELSNDLRAIDCGGTNS